MRCCTSWILLGILLAGCQGQSAPAPTASASVPFVEEPLPKELAALLEEKDYDTAVAAIDKLIQQRPKEYLLYTVRSTIHHRHSRSRQAVEDLDKAISLNGSDARLFNNRGFIKLGMQHLKEATADFDQATKLAPDYPNPYNNRGLVMIANSQYASAIEELDQALRLNPNYVDAYNNRGFAALELQKIDRALADLNTAIRLNPKYVNAYNNRGLLRARLGDLDNAIVDFTQAMMIDPLNPQYYDHRREVYVRQSAMHLAVIDEERRDWLVTLQDLTARILENPRNPTLLVERARHYMAVDDQDKALVDLNRALKIDPNCIPALQQRGIVCNKQKDFSTALADSEKILATAPSQEAYSISGDAYLGLKNYDKAIESFAQARRIDSAVAEAYYKKSQILHASGKRDQAEAALNYAVELNPRLKEGFISGDTDDLLPVPQIDSQLIHSLLELAKDGIRQEEYVWALEYANEVLKIAPSQQADSICGDAFLGLKDYNNAVEYYNRAGRIDAAVVEAYLRKAQNLKAAGRRDEAADCLKRAMALGPNPDADDSSRGSIIQASASLVVPNNDARAMLLLGKDRIRQEDFELALEYANDLLKINPSQEAYSLCGDAWFGLKDYDKAIECYARARRIDANVAEAYYRKAQVLKAAGDHEKSAEVLKYARSLDPEVGNKPQPARLIPR